MKQPGGNNIWACDFETYVEMGQEETHVWSSACTKIGEKGDTVYLFNTIKETLDFFKKQRKSARLYYHNLKFDGEFIVSELLNAGCRLGWAKNTGFKPRKHLLPGEFTVLVSDRGQWYQVCYCIAHGVYLQFLDSVKLIPMSLSKAAKGFKTPHQKTEMSYYGKKSLQKATKKEIEYIKNDVLVLKELLEHMFSMGHTSLTIGSCCLKEYRDSWGGEFDYFFPNIYDDKLPEGHDYGAHNVGEYVLHSYYGAWCYKVGDDIKHCYNGITVDANSLYPSVMHSQSGNRYPVGHGKMWEGDFIPPEATKNNRMYFIRFRCRFELKAGYLPFIHIRNNPLYRATKSLKTSDFEVNGKFYDSLTDRKGVTHYAIPTLEMSQMDFKLFKEHYVIKQLEILDGVYFNTEIGIFDNYINKYMAIKENSEGAPRTIAKLFLNNLYGKFAATQDSSYKIPVMNDFGVVEYTPIEEADKKPGYIPIGSAITSYARCTTIRYAQMNYHGDDKPGFKYADTDSIHADIPLSELVGVPIHDTKICYWKVEREWSEAVFVRQKTYLEVTNGKIEITCAGMPDVCKDSFINAIECGEMELDDFAPGLEIVGKLYPVRYPGGIVLECGSFRILD